MIEEYERKGLAVGTLKAMGAVGWENAVTRKQVAAALGIQGNKGARQVSKLLEQERKTEAICGCSHGLFLPSEGEKGRKEMWHYIRMVEATARGSFHSLRGIKMQLRKTAGQASLDEEE